MSYIKILLIFYFVMLTTTSFCQKNSLDKNQTAFLIGLFDDFLEREIDLYSPNEQCLIANFSDKKIKNIFMDSLKSFLKEDTVKFVFKKDIWVYSLKSCEYVDYFNSYYKLKNLGILPRMGGITTYETYSRRLKVKKFRTLTEKTNFLLGSFIRYGKLLDTSLYSYNYSYSFSHIFAIKKILVELKCRIVSESIDPNRDLQEIIFEPCNELKKLINSNCR